MAGSMRRITGKARDETLIELESAADPHTAGKEESAMSIIIHAHNDTEVL